MGVIDLSTRRRSHRAPNAERFRAIECVEKAKQEDGSVVLSPDEAASVLRLLKASAHPAGRL